MAKKYYTIELAEGIEIHVYFDTVNGLVINYVVKLLLWKSKRYYEVVRYGCPHKDILDKTGTVLSGKSGLSLLTISRAWIWPSKISRIITTCTLRG